MPNEPPSTPSQHEALTIIGRSTSHFTRVTRIFAAEAGLRYAFEVVPSLLSLEQRVYGENPALKLPILRSPGGVWFGALNICRELFRRSSRELRVVWPEALDRPLLANAQELVVQAMSTEVTLLMSRLAGEDESAAHLVKARLGLTNSMTWLERNADAFFSGLPAERQLSYLELTLYCLVRHLPFREVMSIEPYSRLDAFCREFEQRESVRETEYRVDP